MSGDLSDALRQSLARGEPAALVRVDEARGSTPREAGATMLVWAERTRGTIGGGRLEWEAIARARRLLTLGEDSAAMAAALGPELGQCCGGRVTLRLERADAASLRALAALEALERARQPAILVFGAGHVGQALARALALLPFHTRWIDERGELLEAQAPLEGVEPVNAPSCLAEIDSAPQGAAFIVLTHSHSLDAAIAAAVLERGDFAYLGVIGSRTKRRQFERGFLDAGIGARSIARMTCPIGGAAVRDKRPEIIAALTAAEVATALLAPAKADAKPLETAL